MRRKVCIGVYTLDPIQHTALRPKSLAVGDDSTMIDGIGVDLAVLSDRKPVASGASKPSDETSRYFESGSLKSMANKSRDIDEEEKAAPKAGDQRLLFSQCVPVG